MPDAIRIHIDTLEYTRDGLRSRTPLSLDTGREHRVVLVRPDRVEAVGVEGVGFAEGSAFPLPGTLAAFWSSRPRRAPFTHHAELAAAWGASHYQVYGHCDANEGDAKSLSERRAQVGAALLLRDVALFQSLAKEEEWGVAEAQSMLRTLACDPGPVDGKAERLTLDGLRLFTTRYNRGVFHRETGDRPPELNEPTELSSEHEDALREAFVLVHGARLADRRLLETNPQHGCGAFNAPGPAEDTTPIEATRSRRLTVLGHPRVPEFIGNAPCQVGDAAACAIVDTERQRCMWFREHVQQPVVANVSLFDGRWLWLGEDRYVLSALTTANDGEPVTFEVDDAGADSVAPVVLEGVVRGGVASVVWASAETPVREDGHPPHLARPRFTVRHPAEPAAVAHAPWPERRDVALLQLTEMPERFLARSGGVRVVAADGSYDHLVPFSEAVQASSRHLALHFPNVPSDAHLDVWLESGPVRRSIIRGRNLDELQNNIRITNDFAELPPPPGLPSYGLDELEPGEGATVGMAMDTPLIDF